MSKMQFAARFSMITASLWLGVIASNSYAISFNEAGPLDQVCIQSQQLQDREIMVLVIEGTMEDDLVSVRRISGNRVRVIFNGESGIYSANAFQRIRFLGRAGDDSFMNQTNISSAIYGHTGNDILLGGNGNNWIQGGDGDDRIFGGDRNDLLQGRAGNDYINGGKRHDRIFGGEGDDLILGGPGDDFIRGYMGHDTIFGGNGDDRINGGQGNDDIDFGNGNGRDVALYEDQFINFSIENAGDAVLVSRHSLELDMLENVDRIRFDDRDVNPNLMPLELNAEEREVLRLLNIHRSNEGRQPVVIQEDLTRFARLWLEDNLVDLGVPTLDDLLDSHTEPMDRLELLNGTRSIFGENLAWWPSQNLTPEQVAQQVHRLWVNSPGHNANMLRASHDEVGIGVVRTQHGWLFMQIFFSNL